MFTKKTRVLSAIVTVCMLLSMLVSFAMPVAAEGNYDEIQSYTGLTNVTSLPDVKDGLTSAKDYKVTDRAGMDMIATLVAEQSLAGYTFTMANDIDMSGVPFVGIGTTANATIGSNENVANYIFSGTFDGNGFVLNNVYVSQTTAYGVGLFGNAYGATVKNVGIASGLVVGAGYVGGLVGLAHGGTKVLNCWNAATVIGGASAAVGGLIGMVVDGSGSLENSYNLGLVYNYKNAAAGLVGMVQGDNAANYVVKNCYSAGTLVDGLSGFTNSTYEYFGAILRPAKANAATATASSDNYYLDSIGKPGWEKGEEVSTVVKDGATAFKAGEISTLHTKLNNNISSDSDAYTVEYTYSTAGYPVLTYKVGGGVVAKRLPAANAKNVMGNDWKNESTLFATVSSKAQKGLSISSISIDNANDLFVAGFLTSFHTASANFNLANISLTADIDMNDLTLADVDHYIPLGSNGSVKFVVDGQGHTVKNWSSYAYLTTCYVASGGFISLLAGGTVTNLSLEDAYSAYDHYYTAVSGIGYSYPALLVERVRDAESTITECSATGRIDIVNANAANDNNNAGILGRFWGNVANVSNNWCQVTATHSWSETHVTYSCRAIGSANTVPGAGKCLNNYWFSPEELNAPDTGASDNKIIGTTAQVRMTPEEGHTEELAVSLNESSSSALWTIKLVGGEKRLSRAADESETLITLSVQRWIPTPAGYTTDPLPYGDPTTAFYMRNTVFTPENLEGYELDNEQEVPVVLSENNTTINYYMIEPDFSHVSVAEELLLQFSPEFYDEEGVEIFARLEVALDRLDAVADQDSATQVAALYEVMYCYDEAQRYMQSGNMKIEYPNLPAISEYENYKYSGITDWAVKSKADWEYAANVLENGITAEIRLHLTNDIDMENTNVKPLAYGTGFNGLIDGHGYSFYNFKMEHADANGLGNTTVGNEVSWGLVAYLDAAGVIQNLGLATGSMNITNIGSQEQGVGGFAGVAHINSKIINCWNGMSIHAVNKNSPSRVGGIVGRGYGMLYGCYNWGTVTGNSAYTHGLNAYGQNGNGKFYNCYSLPAQDVNKASTTAIGQGGSYVSSTSANITCYQNSWSVGNYLIYDTLNLSTPAAKDYSIAHTLTWDQYDSGYMAYTMNNGIYNVPGIDPVYWTVEGGETVHGTAANATRKLQITINGENVEEEIVTRYENGDAVVDLGLGDYDVIDTVITSGVATLADGMLTMKGTDVIITLTVACNHKGTASYTQNSDGTHDWECSNCDKAGTNEKCEKVGAWENDSVAGKHSASCVCGRVLSETCAYTAIEQVAGADYHKLVCVCGDSKQADCKMVYELIGETHHNHYCADCRQGEEKACAFGDWVYTKAPTYEETGSKSRYCECDREMSEEIAKLTGATVMASAPIAYAGEELTVDLSLAGVSGITDKLNYKMTITYDAAYLNFKTNGFSYNSNVGSSVVTTGTNSVTVTINNATAAEAVFGYLKFDVLKTAPDGKALIEIAVTESDAELNGSFALVDVWEYAWGDANGDKRTTVADVVMILRAAAGEAGVTVEMATCDVWHDRFQSPGSDNKITLSDAVLILRYVMGDYTPAL